MTRRILLLALALVGICTLVGTTQAVVQPHQNEQFEIPLPQFDRHTYKTPATAMASKLAADAVRQQYGGEWGVYSWDPQTKSPSYIIGSGVMVAGSLTRGNDVESVARSVIDQNRDVLRADVANLRFNTERHVRGKVAAHFQQTYQGLDVYGGRVHTTFTEEGRLFVMSSRYYSGIDLNIRPSIPAAVAEDIARQAVPFDPLFDSVSDSELLVLPVALGPEQVEHHLVWKMSVSTESPLGIWVTFVDAHDGEILHRYNDIHFIDYSGSIADESSHITFCDGDQTVPAAYMDITVTDVGTATTDANGDWTLPNADATTRDANLIFWGPYCRVSVQDGGINGSITVPATPGVPLNILWDASNSRADERDCWDQVNDLHDFFQILDPAFEVGIEQQKVNVNLPDVCNAFWSGGDHSINFYPAGGGCANTGEIQSVVAHEYGHHVQHTLLGEQGNEGLGEGNGDIMANLITQESWIGRGFTNCAAGLRNSDNNLIYPDNVIGQPIHNAGRVIAGFNWDAMVLLQQIYGQDAGTLLAAEAWHFGRMLEMPLFQPDQVLATFIGDDDDGNLDNGTPNYDAWCQAAVNHGFSCPAITEGVLLIHDPTWSTEEEGDQQILTLAATLATTNLDSVQVHYSVNGGAFQMVDMAPTGNPAEFLGILPNLTYPSEVLYYIRGTDDQGNDATDPLLAPVFTHAFDVALIYEAMEFPANGFQVNVEGTDDAPQGVWARVTPSGGTNAPDEDTTPPNGVKCWVTGATAPLSNGTSTLYSKIYDITGATQVEVKYSKWYFNETGSFPGEDSWVVQVQNNGGPWLDVENTQQSTDGWETVKTNIMGILGEAPGEVRFKFIASDLINFTQIEAAIDDFTLLGSMSAADAPAPLPSADPKFALFGSSPNPTRGDVTIGFQVPTSSNVELTIFDVTGREVRTLMNEQVSAGIHQLEWNGKDARGHEVASGVYYYKMDAGEYVSTRTIVLSR